MSASSSSSGSYFRVRNPNYVPAPREKAFKAGKDTMEIIKNSVAAGQVIFKNKDQLKELQPGNFVGLNKRKIKYRGGFVIPYANSFIYIKEYPNRPKLEPTRKPAIAMLLAAAVGKEAGRLYRERYPKGTKVDGGKEIFRQLLIGVRQTQTFRDYKSQLDGASDADLYHDFMLMKDGAARKKQEKKTATKQDLQNIIIANQAAAAAFQQQHGFPITEVKTPMRKLGPRVVGQTKATRPSQPSQPSQPSSFSFIPSQSVPPNPFAQFGSQGGGSIPRQ